jgi:hypothetical protein
MRQIEITVIDSRGTTRYWRVENANFNYAINDAIKKCKEGGNAAPHEIKMRGTDYDRN